MFFYLKHLYSQFVTDEPQKVTWGKLLFEDFITHNALDCKEDVFFISIKQFFSHLNKY